MTNEKGARAFKISGMTCGHCKSAVESAIRKVADVREVSVDLEAGTAIVVAGPADHAIIAAVEDAGYEAKAATIDS
jgi:copper chaperone